jgi:peptidyl-prolyl cis-trans isomerase D
MALIGTIRKNSWILVVMLGLGLGGFIIMDVSSAGGRGGQAQFSVGEVNGEAIDWIEFQKAQEALYTNSSIDAFSQRDYVWGYMVEQRIVTEQADAIGLTVGEDEMQELIFGANVSPIVLRNFTDPNTGQLNTQTLNDFRQASNNGTLAPQYQKVWDFQKKEVVKDKLQSKLLTLVKKSIYTPTWMAENIQNDVGSSVNFISYKVAFDQIPDTELDLTDEDYRNYIKAHSRQFDLKEETRDAAFVVFDVFPTPEDTLLLREKFSELVDEFRTTDEDSIFAINNYGSYSAGYSKKEVLPVEIADSVFSRSPGEIYGPYLDANTGAYNAIKILGYKIVPDSVHSRHILIGLDRQEQAPAVIARADSVLQMLNDGLASFDSLARVYSSDQGSAIQGGDLGYIVEFQFVEPMNNLLFYGDAQPGEYSSVPSQFGIHIVEILDRKYLSDEEGVKVASVSELIIPSDATQDEMYDDVLEFAGFHRTIDALTEAAEANDDITLESVKNIDQNSYTFSSLGAGQNSRSIIRWMFGGNAEVKQVAPEVFIFEDPVNYFNAKYVVVGLTGVNKAGLPETENVIDFIESDVWNEKKGEILASRMTDMDITTLQSQFTVEVDSINNVNLSSQIMSGIGDEPKVLGTAMKLQVGETSGPIIGVNGVYIIEVTKHTAASAAQNIGRLRLQGSFQVASAAEFELLDALENKAEIEDFRFKFY